MKKVIFFLGVLLTVSTISAQVSKNDSLTENIVTNDSLQKMSLKQVCAVLGVNYDYNNRYERIILPLCKVGIVLFDKNSNPYTKDLPVAVGVENSNWYYYIGTSKQNESLKRNLIANRNLIINGTLSLSNARRWQVVK
jgi:hypothetical protein